MSLQTPQWQPDMKQIEGSPNLFDQNNRIGDSSQIVASIVNADQNHDTKIQKEEVENLFAWADINHTGLIEKSELRLFLRRHFPHIANSQITRAYNKFDGNHDGSYSFDEFCCFVSKLFPNKCAF